LRRCFPRASGRHAGFLGLVVFALLIGSGCASGDARAPVRRTVPPNAFLLPPADGWAGALGAAQRQALADGFTALARDGEPAAARAAADALLRQTPNFPPALVLAAQTELVENSPLEARKLLETWVGGQPGYRAARLLWARVLELGGDPAGAHAEYRDLAADLPIATERARATREPAVAAAQTALAAALAAGRIDDARTWADRIGQWESPDSTVAFEARLAVARAAEDEPAELDALRGLRARGRSDRELLERLATLELEHGDADEGLHLLEGLVADAPDDQSLRSQLAAAQLRFRLRLLPENVQKLAARPELSRGDFAALIYWMVPGVRLQSSGGGVRIASDVIDHVWQQEIIRVVNKGLMRVDSTMHRFEPDRPITRAEALHSALEVAASRPGGECAQGIAASPSPGAGSLCETATRCAILAEVAECLPQGRLSGGEALGIVGRALSLQKTE
jgi:tetratricopeptide (TPR) repeat protein